MYTFKYLLAKAIKYAHVPAVRGSEISKKAAVCPSCNVVDIRMGDYSYIGPNSSLCSVDVGKFTSIGSGCNIGGGEHPIHHVSTSPVFHSGRNILHRNFSENRAPEPERVSIGNDVWIGQGVFIKSGISIGDGAIIGAHSVVTKDVSPYAIVVGCPAKFLRNRFDDSLIQNLQESKWWDLSDESLYECGHLFNDPHALLNWIRRNA